jgi:hypothetical protein
LLGATDPSLGELVALWTELPVNVRDAMLLLVKR